jgi:hypothetical protein
MLQVHLTHKFLVPNMDLYMHIICIQENCIISSGFSPYATEPSLMMDLYTHIGCVIMMDLYMHIACVIIMFRLGCIREHCIICSGFPPYASEPSLRKT